MMYLELLCLSSIIVFILDLSGFVPYWENKIYKWSVGVYPPLDYDWTRFPLVKLLSCSLCQTFWVGIIYLLITQHFTIFNLGYVALLAFLTPIIKDTLFLVREAFNNLLNLIYKLFE